MVLARIKAMARDLQPRMRIGARIDKTALGILLVASLTLIVVAFAVHSTWILTSVDWASSLSYFVTAFDGTLTEASPSGP